MNPLASGLGSGGDIGGQLKGMPVAMAGKEKFGLNPEALVYTQTISGYGLASDERPRNVPEL